MTEELFNTIWYDPDGNAYKEREWVGAEEAVRCAYTLTRRPATLLALIRKVIITDAGDRTCFLWEHDKGVVFPQPTRGGHA